MQSHILLILPVSVALIASQRDRVFGNVRYCLPAGLVFGLLGSASAWMASHPAAADPDDALSLRMSLFVGCCITGFILCYGMSALRVAAFPMLFLFFIVPIPDFIFERVIWFLQRGSTDAAVLLLKAASIPVVRDGFILSLPVFDIEVTRECSGIRSSLVLLVVALVLGHLFVRSNWRRCLLVLLVLPIAIIRNGLRIFALSALGTLAHPSYLDGDLHRFGGIPLFALSLGVLMLTIWWFRKSESGTLQRAVQKFPSLGQNLDLANGKM
jgi:exosortase